ncbi:MAG: hypothetical protein K6G06_08850 [Butyrivibrio sp.]|nr:hypothetical protein [Butyrivibrio sp.]
MMGFLGKANLMKKCNKAVSVVLLTALSVAAFSVSDCKIPCVNEIHTVEAKTDKTEKTVTKLSTPEISKLTNEYEGIRIQWGSVADADGFYVYKRQKSSQPWELIGNVPATSERSLLDLDSMKDGGLYTYMIQAYKGELLSPQSKAKTITRVVTSRVKFKIEYKQKAARKMQKMVNDLRTGGQSWAWNSANTTKVYMQGLGKLSYDYNLEKIAMKRAAELAMSFSHERPNGKDCFSALDEAGYKYSSAGENIAYGYKSAKAAYKAFAEENNKYEGQGHRRNMLGSSFNVCAFACVRVNGVNYWVQEFAYTQDDSDYEKAVNKVKKTTIEIASDDVNNYKKTLNGLKAKISDYPPSVAEITTTEVNGRKVTLSYTKSKGAAGYVIYRSRRKKSGFEKVGTVKRQTTLSFTDKKASKKKTYYYYVVPYRIAHGDMIYGNKSKVVKVKT